MQTKISMQAKWHAGDLRVRAIVAVGRLNRTSLHFNHCLQERLQGCPRVSWACPMQEGRTTQTPTTAVVGVGVLCQKARRATLRAFQQGRLRFLAPASCDVNVHTVFPQLTNHMNNHVRMSGLEAPSALHV